MTKHLILNGGSENWQLVESADLPALRRTIEDAMKNGDVLQLPVYLADSPLTPVTLLFNGSAAATAVLIEL